MSESAEWMREGARKILADYETPPAGGTFVPRIWVEQNRAELEVWAEVERVMLGDLDNWKPTGLVQALGAEREVLPEGYRFSHNLTPVLPACGKEIRYVTPGGTLGVEPCALLPDHEGDCDSPNLFLRPADAPKVRL